MRALQPLRSVLGDSSLSKLRPACKARATGCRHKAGMIPTWQLNSPFSLFGELRAERRSTRAPPAEELAVEACLRIQTSKTRTRSCAPGAARKASTLKRGSIIFGARAGAARLSLFATAATDLQKLNPLSTRPRKRGRFFSACASNPAGVLFATAPTSM